SRPVPSTRVEPRALELRASEATSSAASTPRGTVAAAAPSPPPAAPRDADDDISWGWPAAGPVAVPFDESKNKGLVFRGKAGDPVLAAADGRVVYAGSGLRGYGNLIILKHNATYLTAYAHNQTLLVKDDQTVRKGQKIAEMGSTDADSVQLHFEIRRQGKPVDPAKLLPPR
ncbi:MAG TPA: peptidoglycan DD-metalloendopeptidase family protein, partial [Caldimonas sp.]|nr:peptidoglycan DD-metalloendopeptidase family protein [Caldimonas sp.]